MVVAGVGVLCNCNHVRQRITQPGSPVYLSGTPPWRVVYSGRHRCSEPEEEPLATVVPEDQGEGEEAEEEEPGVLVPPWPGASAAPPQQHSAVMRPDCAA